VAVGAIGFLALLGFLSLGLLGTLMDIGDAPSERVLSVENISDKQYRELVAEGIIAEDEILEYFFSEGVVSIKEGGSILTNYRVIAYEQDEDGQIQTYYIPNDDIEAVTLVKQGDLTNYSIYQVTAAGEDNWLQLVLPHEHGDGERFANAVKAKIRQRK
jgi:hypothetical protein